MTGRTIRTERPGFSGVEVSENQYNDKGQLVSSTTPGMADTLYEYDELGNRTRSGLDVNNNGTLDNDSSDRITRTDTRFASQGGYWWNQTTEYVYDTLGVDSEKLLGSSRNRLTGLGGSGLLSQSVTTDIHGNQTTRSSYLDKAAHKITTIVRRGVEPRYLLDII